MLRWDEAFWSLPEELKDRVWVTVWLADLPAMRDQLVNADEGECFRVDKLMDTNPQGHFAYRSLQLFEDGCDGRVGISPLLLDIDVDQKTLVHAEEQRDRVVAYGKRRAWRFRVFSSGEGYHVEVDPLSVFERPLAAPPEYQGFLREVKQDLDGSGFGEHAVIDVSHDWIRVSGSANRKGGFKMSWPSDPAP